jgi:regulator of cell morphogenesis and NO signaling
MGYADRTVAEIATQLPGATAVFRAHKIDYCCGGARPLAAAAADRIELEQLESELAQLAAGARSVVPLETNALIDHILTRFHETHRRELPELVKLAARVEARHAGHAQVPVGLKAALLELSDALEDHMAKEEQILFPLMRQGGHPMIHAPIGRMQVEHDEHGERLARLEALTHGLALPEVACPTWRALYAGLRKLIDDVHEHVHLENNDLFARFQAAPRAATGT